MKISVVIPTWNRAHIIGDCLRSVLNQTLSAHEILVIDDGSQDTGSTLRVVQFVQKNNPEANIRYVRQDNAGPAAARNTGVRHATGEWIYFLDSDDIALPHTLSALSEVAERHPLLSVIFGRAENVSGGERSDYIHDKGIADAMATTLTGPIQIFDTLLRANVIPMGAVMVKRKLCQQLPFDPTLRLAEDYDAWLCLACSGYGFGYVNAVLLKRAIHCGNLISQKTAMNEVVVRILERYVGWSVAVQRVSALHYDLGSAYLRQRDWDMAALHLAQADGTRGWQRVVLAVKRALAGIMTPDLVLNGRFET